MEKNTLSYKINFWLILSVANTNPNGDPGANNRPRTIMKNGEEYGFMSQGSIKYRIRNEIKAEGLPIYGWSYSRRNDNARNEK